MYQNAPALFQAGERYLDGKGKRKLGETSISVDDLKGIDLPAKIPATYDVSAFIMIKTLRSRCVSLPKGGLRCKARLLLSLCASSH
jgi:hypothetical protein